MFNQELVILGLLKEGPKHGYEIKKLIHKIAESFATIKTKSIYYPLKVMERQNLVRKEIKKQLRRPEKFIYRITAKGEVKFQKLIEKNLLSLERPFLNVDMSLYFLPFVDKELFIRRLKVRQKGLVRIKNWLCQKSSQRKSLKTHQLAILNHNLELVRAEINFNSHLIDNFHTIIKNS